MQEIEIKFKVDNLEEIKNRLLQENYIFSEELNQKDTVFVPNINDTSIGEGKMFVRIRSVNDTFELNLKRRSSNQI